MFIVTWNFYFVNNGLKNENRQKRALSIYANSVIKPRKDTGNSKQTAPFQSTGTGRRPMRGFFCFCHAHSHPSDAEGLITVIFLE
jgi:hypothetical protein